MSLAAAPGARPDWDRIQWGALVVGVTGLILCVVGALVSPEHFFRSYLVAFNFWLGIALGCLVILMVQHMTGGGWGLLLRRVLESGARTLLPLALFAVPLVFGLHSLYLWAQPEADHDPDLVHKQAYLNPWFFIIRLAVYFAVWLVLAGILNRWSVQQDQGGERPGQERRFRILSGPGLVLYGLTITFASIDWVMSLEPHWFSTIYPAVFGVGQVLEGMAFSVAVLALLSTQPPLSAVVKAHHRRDLGNMLLVFVMIWAYLSFSQFLLIWAENMPEETPYYLRRTRDGWQWIALALLLFQFAIPFVFLLFRDVKENPRRLIAVAVLVLVMRFVDVYWWVEAAFPGGVSFYWLLDLAALAGLGGLWTWWFLYELRKRPLLPLHDPFLAEYLPEAVSHE